MVDPALIERAKHPDLRIGRGLLADELRPVGRWALLSQPGPFEALAPELGARFHRVATVTSLTADSLDALVADLDPVDGIAGVGGGMTLDAAKYVAWRRSIPLVLAPSIVSVDAAVTNTIAVRRGDRVVYEGFVVAERIVADLDLIAGAPARLNRAGVGDLLSIHTALVDWRRSADAGGLPWDDEVARRSAAVLDRIYALSGAVAAVTDQALESILLGYAEVNALCLTVGHSGPEEGSEHYLAYHVEALTGRSFVHGELVGLGAVLMARLQDNDPQRVVTFLDGCDVRWRPGDLALDRDLLRRALVELPAFVRRAGLPRSVVDDEIIDAARADRLLAGL